VRHMMRTPFWSCIEAEAAMARLVDLQRTPVVSHAAEAWIRQHVHPAGPIELVHARAWATVARVPLDAGCAYFKACGPSQAFEPPLTAELANRWPDRVGEVLAVDPDERWLLLADAGTQLRLLGNSPEVWLRALPRYAELQLGEVAHSNAHLVDGVPDRRLRSWPASYSDLLQHDLPLTPAELSSLRQLAPRFEESCRELAAYAVPATLQHDDLHYNNLFVRDTSERVLDWGDSSISHPFASLVVTFRYLEEFNGLSPGDPWFDRLRQAYLEPWGADLAGAFPLALKLSSFAHAFGWLRQRETLTPAERSDFDTYFAVVLRRALRQFTE
jgi:hypothetical protein